MGKPVRIELHPLGTVLETDPGAPLQDILFRYGVEFPCGGQGRCRGCRVKVLSGRAPSTAEDAAVLSGAELEAGWRLACCLRVESDLVLELAQWEMSILGDESHFLFTPAEGLGIAIDLGTTTLVAQLVDLSNGCVIGVESALNPQARFGSDIMTRVETALEPHGAASLRNDIREALGGMVARLTSPAAGDVTRIAIVGNTVMHHLFCGIDVAPLAGVPFETAEPGAREFRKAGLEWSVPGNPAIVFLGCVGGFVGSDIVAGVVATGIGRGAGLDGLMDLGTNGEIVFGTRDRMICASTAAGPAFEGGRISMGMRAARGAIAQVSTEGGGFRSRVLGGTAALGICGSGLVDAVAGALELGLLRPDGRLIGRDRLVLAAGVDLVQRDIREVQLAKAAIAAGVDIVLHRLQGRRAAVDRVHLAGAFGNYINRGSAERIGLVEFAPEVVRPAGNTALLGAKLALFSPEFECREFEATRRWMEHISLASDPSFEEVYLQKMNFAGGQ